MTTYQELIENSLTLCGKGYEGQVASGQTLKTALSKLNNILGDWEAREIGTWTESKYKFCLTVGKDKYTVGTSQDIDINKPLTIVECRTKVISGAVTWKGETTIATFLALTSGTEGDYYQFTDSNSTIDIGDYGVLSADVSALITSDDYDIVDDTGTYIDLNEYKSYDYTRLPSKFSTGTPVIYHYDPGTTTGTLYLWRTGNTGQQIEFTAFHGWQEVTTSNVTSAINFPNQWRIALEYTLASELGYLYGTPTDKLDRLEAKASSYLETAIGTNKTEGGIVFYASHSD